MSQGLSRDSFIAQLGQSKLAEELVDLDGIGKVLCRELTGATRAKLLGVLAPAASGAQADFERYQELLLQHGLVDPADGQPLLDVATVKDVMKLGASKVELLCSTIERLSGLDKQAAKRAEGNSEPTVASSGSSG